SPGHATGGWSVAPAGGPPDGPAFPALGPGLCPFGTGSVPACLRYQPAGRAGVIAPVLTVQPASRHPASVVGAAAHPCHGGLLARPARTVLRSLWRTCAASGTGLCRRRRRGRECLFRSGHCAVADLGPCGGTRPLAGPGGGKRSAAADLPGDEFSGQQFLL